MRPSITLKQIAAQAGVSVPTASRALSGKGRVAEDTRKKVLKIAQEAGYVPHLAPRPTVGLLYSRRLHSLSTDAFYGAVIEGIEDECRVRGGQLVIASVDSDDRGVARSVLAERYQGLIVLGADLAPSLIKQIQDTGTPLVLVDNELDDGSADAVVIANERGMRQMTDRLIQLGHQNLAYIGGPQHHVSLRQRYQGFRIAVTRAGIDVDPRCIQLVEDVEYSVLTGQLGVERLLKGGARFSAVICDNDDVAIGAIQELTTHGFEVPRHVSVSGFDGRPIIIRPLLTTVVVARHQIGQLAARRLFEIVGAQGLHPVTITVATEVVEKETTIQFSKDDTSRL